jgi:hypothetical protein
MILNGRVIRLLDLIFIVKITIIKIIIHWCILMRIIKIKKFAKWADKCELTDEILREAAREIVIGIYEANYGGGVIKKRIANKGRGKSGSTRAIVAFKKDHNCYFMFGFEKDEKSDITENEEKTLKLVAKNLLLYTEDELDCLIQEGSLIEVKNEQNN